MRRKQQAFVKCQKKLSRSFARMLPLYFRVEISIVPVEIVNYRRDRTARSTIHSLFSLWTCRVSRYRFAESAVKNWSAGVNAGRSEQNGRRFLHRILVSGKSQTASIIDAPIVHRSNFTSLVITRATVYRRKAPHPLAAIPRTAVVPEPGLIRGFEGD